MIFPIIFALLQKPAATQKPKPTKAVQAPKVNPETGMFLLGQYVTLSQPTEASTDVPKEVANWPGWHGLTGGQTPNFPKSFAVDGNWSSIWQNLSLIPNEKAVDWPVRGFIVRRSEGLIKHGDGLVTSNRATIEQRRLNLVLESLLRAKALFQKQSGGQLNLKLIVSDDQHPIMWSGDQGDERLPAVTDLDSYLNPRFNAGSFVANDQIYRGPFRSVIVIAPTPGPTLASSTVKNTQVDFMSTVTADLSPGLFTSRILGFLDSSVKRAATAQGYRETIIGGRFQISNPFSSISATPSELAKSFWATNEDYNAHQKLPMMGRPEEKFSVDQMSSVSSEAEVTTIKDGAVQALKVTLPGLHRRGGMDLPLDAESLQALKDGQYLTFRVKTKSADPLHLNLAEGSSLYDVVSLGNGIEHGNVADLPSDGNWHTVSVSFKQAFEAHPNADAVVIGADPKVTSFEKIEYVADTDELADFAITSNLAADAVAIGEGKPFKTELDAAKVWTWTDPTDPTFRTNFEMALADHRDLVVLNALMALQKVDGSSVVASIINAFTSINPQIVDQAALALQHQNVPAAWAYLVFSTVHGINSRSRAAAGLALSYSGIIGYASQVGSLIGQRDWYARYCGAEALGILNNSGKDPDHLINTYLEPYLEDSDPQVRQEAILSLDGSDPKALSKILYAAVNDGADAVRVAAYEKVLLQGSPDLQHQSLSGFTDDSWDVRKQMFQFCAASNNRDAEQQKALDAVVPDSIIQKGLADECPYVRAAALECLASRSKDLPPQDLLEKIGTQEQPIVQLSLENLAAQYKWKLPYSVLSELANSSDSDVANMAKTLQANK